MKYYRFRLQKFMEIFKDISGYDESLYAYGIAERAALYIAKDYMDCPSEYWYTEDAMNFAVEHLTEVFDLTEYDVRQAFEEAE